MRLQQLLSSPLALDLWNQRKAPSKQLLQLAASAHLHTGTRLTASWMTNTGTACLKQVLGRLIRVRLVDDCRGGRVSTWTPPSACLW